MNIKKMMIAVDASENAKRAVEYVGGILAPTDDITIELVHVVTNKARDLFPDEESWERHKKEQLEAAEKILSELKQTLMDYGLKEDSVNWKILTIDDLSVARALLGYQKDNDFGTIVVGRRGMSKAEEFLFGSVSNKIVHYAKNCAVWVIE